MKRRRDDGIYVIVSMMPGARRYYCGQGDNAFAPRVSAHKRDAVLFCGYEAARRRLGALIGTKPGDWRIEIAGRSPQ